MHSGSRGASSRPSGARLRAPVQGHAFGRCDWSESQSNTLIYQEPSCRASAGGGGGEFPAAETFLSTPPSQDDVCFSSPHPAPLVALKQRLPVLSRSQMQNVACGAEEPSDPARAREPLRAKVKLKLVTLGKGSEAPGSVPAFRKSLCSDGFLQPWGHPTVPSDHRRQKATVWPPHKHPFMLHGGRFCGLAAKPGSGWETTGVSRARDGASVGEKSVGAL